MSNIIEQKKLTELEVLQIVNEWYTNGMYADILQNEDGLDLEEICLNLIDLLEATEYILPR
jgi:hypothetical protein